MLIFKEITVSLRLVNSRMLAGDYTDDLREEIEAGKLDNENHEQVLERKDIFYMLDRKRKEILLDVKKKIQDEIHKEERLLYFLRNKMSYNAMAEQFNISKTAATSYVTRIGKKVELKIGKGLITDIMKAHDLEELELIRTNLSMCGMLGGELLMLELATDMNKVVIPKEVDVVLKECTNELEFILKYSKYTYEEDLKKQDKEKLGYLRELLQGKDGTVIKLLMQKYLQGDVTDTQLQETVAGEEW